MKIEATPEDVIEGTTDSRGRMTLGSEYANEDMTLLIVDKENE